MSPAVYSAHKATNAAAILIGKETSRKIIFLPAFPLVVSETCAHFFTEKKDFKERTPRQKVVQTLLETPCEIIWLALLSYGTYRIIRMVIDTYLPKKPVPINAHIIIDEDSHKK
jgi:hypothetical protein